MGNGVRCRCRDGPEHRDRSGAIPRPRDRDIRQISNGRIVLWNTILVCDSDARDRHWVWRRCACRSRLSRRSRRSSRSCRSLRPLRSRRSRGYGVGTDIILRHAIRKEINQSGQTLPRCMTPWRNLCFCYNGADRKNSECWPGETTLRGCDSPARASRANVTGERSIWQCVKMYAPGPSQATARPFPGVQSKCTYGTRDQT